MTYNFIELCSGCGGMSTGFIQAGLKAKLLVDKDKNCIATLKKNHKNTKILQQDMTKIKYNDTNGNLKDFYKNTDILVAGLPCQSFSYMGKNRGLKDHRGKLFYNFSSTLYKLKPKIFVIENVKGLLTHDKGNTIKKIQQVLSGNYNLYIKLLNSNDYDVAQTRHRLFIVGVIKDIKKKYVFPKESNKKRLVLRDILYDVPDSDGYVYNVKKYNIMKLIPQDGCWVNLPIELQKGYLGKSYYTPGGKRGIAKRLSMDKPSPTLTTSPCQKTTERCHPLYTRPLNIREYARIQSFPDEYEFIGSISSIYRQIGNAVPVNLAKYIGISIKDFLDENTNNRK